MKNQEIIPLKELETMKLLFIENDSQISPTDYNTIHHFLKGSKGDKAFRDYDVEFIFDAYSVIDGVLEAFNRHENVLLYTSFTGESADMLWEFINQCILSKITNKRIFTLYCKDLLNSYSVNSVMNDIIKLDNEQNVSLYTLEDFGQFEKLTSRI